MNYHCPICKKSTDSKRDADFPFCSEQCRLLDLGAWAAEKYVVSEPIFDEEEIAEPEQRQEWPATEGGPCEGTRKSDDTIQ